MEASNKILPGVISSVHADETFDIELSTGEQLEKIPREQILPCAPQQCMVTMMGATIDEPSLEMMEITATMLSDEKNCMRSHTIAGMYQVLHSAKVARSYCECMVVGMMALHQQHPRLYEPSFSIACRRVFVLDNRPDNVAADKCIHFLGV